MPQLVLGPVLRYVGETEATIWLETDGPAEAEVLGCRARTFHAGGHHYALVHVQGLEAGSSTPYELHLDGERVWPQDGSPFPPSRIRTPAPDRPSKLAFGSCRVAAPHEPPHSLPKDEHPSGREVCALRLTALRMLEQPEEEWPDRLLLLGDQVYADEVSPGVLDFIRRRRGTDRPPGEQVADFEEYTQLYLESWSEPTLRWLLSTLASAMIFDDHDVHDDWNISESWLRDMRRLDWWDARVAGAFASYWIYQHLGNLAPGHLHDDEVYDKVLAADDALPLLSGFGIEADRETDGTRWSFCRDYGGVRVLVIDSRAGRVLKDGRRCMVDDHEWRWICERLVGGHDHLVVGTSLPLLLGPGMHYLEAWNEAVCDGAWGPLAARLGEKLRRGLDLEHWAAFDESFRRLCDRLRAVAAGEHGEPPATITILSGDVHHAYLSEVAFRRGSGVKSHVWQAVCSPFRNPLDRRERRMIRFGTSRAAWAIGRALAKAAGVEDPDVRWRMVKGPVFDNQIATLTLDGRQAHLTLERTTRETDEPVLKESFSHRLA